MNERGPSVIAMIALVALVVAVVILVFFGIGYALGRGVDFQGGRGLVLLAGVIVAVFLCYAAVLGVTKFSIGPAEA